MTSTMKKITYIATAALVCGGLLFTSCRKKEVEDNDTAGAADYSLAETYSNDISNIGTQASYANLSTYKTDPQNNIYSTCATLDFDTLNSGDPDTMTVDFGAGCTGNDGRTRKGVLQFTHLAGMHYRDSGNVITVATPGNTYHVDGNQVIINTWSITNNGHSAANGYLNWSVSHNVTINRSNGTTVSVSSNKTKFLLAGEQPNNQPINWPAAKVAIYGSGNGTHIKNGSSTSFSFNVNQGSWLVRDFSCTSFRRYFVAGVLEFTPGSKPARIVNFGTGACDNLATVTINGHVYNITLN